MEFTLADILDNKNNGKEFIIYESMSIVKNVDGCLFFAQNVGFISTKDDNANIVHLKRIAKKTKWQKAPASAFWVNAKYKELN